MDPLQHPDTLHLRAALGWLELDNHLEANEELDRIQPELRAHPDVLKLRWEVFVQAKEWEMAQEISGSLTRLVPDDPRMWQKHAHSFHFAGNWQAAYDIVFAQVPRFPKDWMLLYDLACYCSRLGRLEEARQWLHRAMELGNRKELQQAALDDPDLEALRKAAGLA